MTCTPPPAAVCWQFGLAAGGRAGENSTLVGTRGEIRDPQPDTASKVITAAPTRAASQSRGRPGVAVKELAITCAQRRGWSQGSAVAGRHRPPSGGCRCPGPPESAGGGRLAGRSRPLRAAKFHPGAGGLPSGPGVVAGPLAAPAPEWHPARPDPDPLGLGPFPTRQPRSPVAADRIWGGSAIDRALKGSPTPGRWPPTRPARLGRRRRSGPASRPAGRAIRPNPPWVRWAGRSA